MVEGFRTIGNLELKAVVYKYNLTLVLYIHDSYRFVICESLFCRVGWKRLSGYKLYHQQLLVPDCGFYKPLRGFKTLRQELSDAL